MSPGWQKGLHSTRNFEFSTKNFETLQPEVKVLLSEYFQVGFSSAFFRPMQVTLVSIFAGQM